MCRLAISLFGSFQVALDETPVTQFGADTARALLAYLAMHPQTTHRRETLTGLLWPDQPEAAARHNLSQALHRLRTAIRDHTADPPFFAITRQTIGLGPESRVWLDVAAFREALAACRAHGHRRIEMCGACADLLHEAADLYRGEFLSGFSLDSVLFEQWLVTQREELHRQVLGVLGDLVGYHEAQGDYEEAIRYAQRRVALEPWQEDAHRQLMRALALSNDRAAALAQYETCRRALEQELGIEPEPETQALYERIRDGRELQARPSLPPHDLPAQFTSFIGRKDLLAEIGERIEDPACRLLTLVGPGGSGKTRLALEAARGILSEGGSEPFDNGVFFVSLAAVQSIEGMVSAIGQAIGFSFHQGGNPRQQLFNYLRNKRMLLILDNMEHLLALPISLLRHQTDIRAQGKPPQETEKVAVLVTDILSAAPSIQIVTTSRAGLNVRGEHLTHIEGMSYPQALSETASHLDQYGAVQLFLASAREIRSDREATADDLAHIVRICQLVQGMPLAILLAASWITMLSPAEIADEIAQTTDFLATDWPNAPKRQRSMRAVFDHSWQLLSQREHELFAALSVFRGGFTRHAAQQVMGVTMHELMALVNKSLLHRTPTGRYEMHELLRQYAAEKLGQVPDGGEGARDRHGVVVRDKHCAYYATALHGWEADLKSARQQAALAEMGVEIGNARAAWDWAAERGYVEQLDLAMDGLCHFYRWHGHLQEGESACQMAAERLSAMTRPSAMGRRPLTARGDRLRILAKLWTVQGGFSRDDRLLRQSLSLLEGPELADRDTRAEKALLFARMAGIASDSDPRRCKQLLEQSLALYEELGDRWETANTLRELGRSAWLASDYAEMRQSFQQSLAIFRSLGDPDGISSVIWWFSTIACLQGEAETAEHLARESLAIQTDRYKVAHGLKGLANALTLSGKYTEAHSLLEEALAVFTDLGVCNQAGVIVPAYQSKVKMELGLYEQAHTQAGKALEVARGMRSWRDIGWTLCVLGSIMLAEGAYTEAQCLLQESITTYRETDKRDELAWALACAGYAARGLGQPAQARRHLCEALRIGAETGAFLPLITALPATALLLADAGGTARGEPECAVELYALASRYQYVAHSRWFEAVAGREIAAAAEALPPEVAAAAQERGRARDLWATAEELLEELTEQRDRCQ
jgi:DNA-binding SARP family transcriptional activator/predicted ATPase